MEGPCSSLHFLDSASKLTMLVLGTGPPRSLLCHSDEYVPWQQVQRILRESYQRVTALLGTNENQLHDLAKALIEHETLTQKDIREVLDGTFVSPGGAPGTPPPADVKSDKSEADDIAEGSQEHLPAPAPAASTSAAQ